MKQCPKCSRAYNDETLNFCLDDGDWLHEVNGSSEPSTAILTSEASTKVYRSANFRSDPKSTTPKTSALKRKVLAAGILSVLLAAAAGIGGFWLYGSRAGKQVDSIAVMPFVNESGNPEIEYLSDGMTETLIASLSQLPDLNVKARSSVFRYKGKAADAQTIGKELNVQAILNGRVVQRGQDLILNVELIEAQTENVLWTENYSRKIANLVSLQTDVARDLYQKLRTKLSRADEQKLRKGYTENAEAYDLYLQGKSAWNKRTRRDVEISVGFFQRAINADPNFALAYAGLAEAYAQPSQQPQGMPRAREAALKALSLDQDLAEAHIALGRVFVDHDHNFAEAEREYRRAIELNANLAAAHSRYGALLTFLGKFEAAEIEFRRALDLEPLSPIINFGYGSMLINSRRYDEAIAHLKKALESEEDFFLTHANLARAYQLKGNYQASIEERARVAEINENAERAAGIRDSFERGGWEGYLRFARREIEVQGSDQRNFYAVARTYIELGEKDKAFAALNAAYEKRESDLLPIKVDPLLDPLRSDPRFQELLKKMGFPE